VKSKQGLEVLFDELLRLEADGRKWALLPHRQEVFGGGHDQVRVGGSRSRLFCVDEFSSPKPPV